MKNFTKTTKPMKQRAAGLLMACLMAVAALSGCSKSKLPEEPVAFTAQDLDGNSYNSEDIFKEHKVTMVNIWGTFCGPCIEEMPELGQLSKEFEAKGYGLIGVIADGNEEPDAAKKIIAETGADYLHIIANDEINAQLPSSAVPCTYFIDSEGNAVGDVLYGSTDDNIARYTAAMELAAGLAK